MNRETILGGALLAVVVGAALVLLTVPGAIADPQPSGPPARPGALHIAEVTIAPASVDGGTATLTVDARLSHRQRGDRSASENVTVRFRATDTDSGLVETTKTVTLGTVDGTREVPAVANLTLPREGSYRIDVLVYRDGERVRTGSTTVSGMAALTPEYARSSLTFERFERSGTVPTLVYSIDRARNGSVTMNVSAYVTNGGDDAAGDVEVRLLALQSESNVAADRATLSVGRVQAGRTVAPAGTLTVPDDYNYRLVAQLVRDGVVLDTVQAPANLDPEEPVTVTESEDEDSFDAGDFDDDPTTTYATESTEAASDEAERTTAASGGQPGFTLPLALLAATVLVAALARRHTDD